MTTFLCNFISPSSIRMIHSDISLLHTFCIPYELLELCLSLLSSRKCTVISPVQRENFFFFLSKIKIIIFQSLLSIMMTEIIISNPQVRKISHCFSQSLCLLFFCLFFFTSSFIIINHSLYSRLFFINTPFGSHCGSGMYFCFLKV